MNRRVVIALVGVALLGLVAWRIAGSRSVDRFTGFVEGEERIVRSEVTGRVLEVAYREGDEVPPDSVVARLDARDTESRIESKRRELAVLEAETRSQVERVELTQTTWERDLAARHADVDQATSAADLAERTFVRERDLVTKGASTAQFLDDASAARDQAASALTRSRAMLARTEAEKVAHRGRTPHSGCAARAPRTAARADRGARGSAGEVRGTIPVGPDRRADPVRVARRAGPARRTDRRRPRSGRQVRADLRAGGRRRSLHHRPTCRDRARQRARPSGSAAKSSSSPIARTSPRRRSRRGATVSAKCTAPRCASSRAPSVCSRGRRATCSSSTPPTSIARRAQEARERRSGHRAARPPQALRATSCARRHRSRHRGPPDLRCRRSRRCGQDHAASCFGRPARGRSRARHGVRHRARGRRSRPQDEGRLRAPVVRPPSRSHRRREPSFHRDGSTACRARSTSARVHELLERAGLLPFADRPAGALSGGMRQKLAITNALLPKPRLLILDEPTAGVDVVARSELWSMLEAARSDALVVISTSYVDEAAACDALAYLERRARGGGGHTGGAASAHSARALSCVGRRSPRHRPRVPSSSLRVRRARRRALRAHRGPPRSFARSRRGGRRAARASRRAA